MKRLRRTILPLMAAATLAVAAIAPASASPANVFLQAGTCYGGGGSALNYPGGLASTGGCTGSAVYLSSSFGYSPYCVDNLYGNWYAEVYWWGGDGECSGVVTAVASTHNLAYITDQSGYYGTNTW